MARSWQTVHISLKCHKAVIVRRERVFALETGSPSIPETAVIESRRRGVLDAPHKRGIIAEQWGAIFQPHVHPGRSHSRNPNETSATLPTPQNQSAMNHSRRCLSGRSVNDSRSPL